MGNWPLKLATCTLMLASCGSEDFEPRVPDNKSNLQIAQRIYSDQRRPLGFFQEPQRDPGISYVIQHIKSNQISISQADFELCTDDFAVALDWSERFNLEQGVLGTLTDTSDTHMYFEFSRTLPGNSNRSRLERIFHCSYLDRSGVDLGVADYAGSLNTQPITKEQVRTVAEYLWTFSLYNNLGSIVVDSRGREQTDFIEHDLSIARKLDGAGTDGCDFIELIQWQYQATTPAGTLSSEEQGIGGFSATKENGSIRLCD